MIEAYTVGATLELFDVVSAPLLKIAKAFEELDVLIKSVQGNLKGIGAEAFGIKAVANASKDLDRYLAGANLNAERLEKNLARVKALGIGSGGNGPPIPIPGYGGGSRRGGGSHGGIHYGAGGVGMSSATMALGDAFVPLAIGATAAYGAHALYESAKDYETAFQRFKALNLGNQVNSEADKFAQSAHLYGISAKELMGVLSESVGLFGSFDEARKFAPKIAELGRANATIFQGKTGELDEEGMMGLTKFIDRRGGFKDEASFQRNLDLAEKLITGSGGRIKFGDLDKFSQRGGTGFRGLSDEGIMGMAGLLIEQGGSAAGVGFMSMYQNLIAGRTPIKTMRLMQDMGLGTLTEKRSGTVGGRTSTITTMSNVKGADLLQSDPRRWYDEIFIPALAKKGITKDADIIKMTNDLLSNRTASNQGTIFTQQGQQLLRDYNLTKGATNAKQVVDAFKKTGAGAEADFDAAWEDFKREWGKSILPTFTSWIKSAADLLRTISGLKAGDPSAIPKAAEIAKNFGTGTMLNMIPGVKPVRDLINMFGSDKPSAYVPPASSAQRRSVGDVYIDGRKAGVIIAPHVSGVMAKEMNKPQSSSSSFDPTRTMLPVGLTR